MIRSHIKVILLSRGELPHWGVVSAAVKIICLHCFTAALRREEASRNTSWSCKDLMPTEYSNQSLFSGTRFPIWIQEYHERKSHSPSAIEIGRPKSRRLPITTLRLEPKNNLIGLAMQTASGRKICQTGRHLAPAWEREHYERCPSFLPEDKWI